MKMNEKMDIIEKLNSLSLKEIEKEVFLKRYGIGEEKRLTVEEIMNIYKIKKEEVGRIEAKVLRLFRHPRRSRKLKDFLNQEDTEDKKDEEDEQLFGKLNEEIIAEKKYTEKEINEILKKYCQPKDYISFRKELIEKCYLKRRPDCKEYWRIMQEKK